MGRVLRPIVQLLRDPAKVSAKVHNFPRLDRMFRMPACCVLLRSRQCLSKAGTRLFRDFCLGAYAGECFLSCHDPVVEQDRVAHQKWGHPQPSRIADTKTATQLPRQCNRIRSTFDAETTVAYAALVSGFTLQARRAVKTLDPDNDLRTLRIRSRKHEIILASEFEGSEYTLVVVQEPLLLVSVVQN